MIVTPDQLTRPEQFNVIHREIPPSAQKLPQVEVERAILEIGRFYKVPEKAISRGLKTEVYFVSAKDLAETTLAEVNRANGKQDTLEDILRSIEEKQREFYKAQNLELPVSPETVAPTLEEVLSLGGICLSVDDQRSLVLIDQKFKDSKPARRHELIHAMADNGPAIGGGFVTPRGVGNKLNEAVTETLEIAQRVPRLVRDRLADIQYIEGGHGNHESVYNYELYQLGSVLEYAEDFKPLTPADLAVIMFNPNLTPQQRQEALRQRIFGTSIDPAKPPWLFKLFERMIE